ncbi:hypothetical protein ACHQM5_026544 [Ranunculus cassubicifolius]
MPTVTVSSIRDHEVYWCWDNPMLNLLTGLVYNLCLTSWRNRPRARLPLMYTLCRCSYTLLIDKACNRRM